MLTITPCLDRDAVMPYCKRLKRPYSPALYLYRAENRGALLAAALFEIGGDCVQILLYETADRSDVALFDGVLRAGLNYASDQGIENGFLPEEFHAANKSLFATLNYPIHQRFNITNFFRKYKRCQ